VEGIDSYNTFTEGSNDEDDDDYERFYKQENQDHGSDDFTWGHEMGTGDYDAFNALDTVSNKVLEKEESEADPFVAVDKVKQDSKQEFTSDDGNKDKIKENENENEEIDPFAVPKKKKSSDNEEDEDEEEDDPFAVLDKNKGDAISRGAEEEEDPFAALDNIETDKSEDNNGTEWAAFDLS